MLTPEQIEALGISISKVVGGIERDVMQMLLAQAKACIERGDDFPTMLKDAASIDKRVALTIAEYKQALESAATAEVVHALATSDSYDLRRVKKDIYDLPAPIRATLSTSASSLTATVIEALRRDNLSMGVGAKADYLDTMSRHVTLLATGAEGTRDAVKRATREMAERGIRTITYDSKGRQHKDKADVAIRRHLRTQITQATCKRTMDICDGAGCKFVEVSSHTGARPSHADWQGKIYSLTGATVVDGEEIADFYEATGYEGKTGTHASLADRLGGINCRHSFAPWVPGMGHAYSTTPDEDAGWDREEVYKDTQKQRALEAEIRKNKRIAANESATDLKKAEAKAKIWNAQKKLRELTSSKPWLRRDASREKAPELAVQPRGAKRKSSMKAWEGAEFGGTFGGRTVKARRDYAKCKGVSLDERTEARFALFNERNHAGIAKGSNLKGIAEKKQTALLSGLELAMKDMRLNPAVLRYISAENLDGEIARLERRGNSFLLKVDKKQARRLDTDQIEQVAYHEIGHMAAQRLLSKKEWESELNNLIAYRNGGRYLPQTKASRIVTNELVKAKIPARYSSKDAKIRFNDEASEEVSTLRYFSEYAFNGAERGMQDDELIAEGLRYYGVHGPDNNVIADAIYDAIIGGERDR